MLGVSAALLGLSLFGDPVETRLRYDRSLIGTGELWRLITGHVVHLGLRHALLNVVGLVLVGLLFAPFITVTDWVRTSIVAALTISAGLFWLSPTVAWYVGFSGVLHGLFVAGAMAMAGRERTLAILLLIGLAGKLFFEQVAGPVPGSEQTAGGPVIVDAHLYGAIGGWLAATLGRVLKGGIRRL
ncbi:MAG: rhombosortase [Pseudomonadota bacterium]